MPWRSLAGSMPARVEWVDYAKGLSIFLVVMMHATLGVESATGHDTSLHALVEWARPFRMPAFFLVSGLFLPRAMARPWRVFFDRRVLHFAWFFALWTIILGLPRFIVAAGEPVAALRMFAFSMIEPFGILWFIYLLPLFAVVTRLAAPLPPALTLLAAAGLQSLELHTGSTVIDEFSARYVYFLAGALFAPAVFALAGRAAASPRAAAGGLAAWAALHTGAVWLGWSAAPKIGRAHV
jgi:uncharacterized membrane protein YcfT